jgi:hypothetical protein
MEVARVLRAAGGCLAALALACATAQAGRPYQEASADGRERLEGVELGSGGSAGSGPYVPLIALCRDTIGGEDAGNVFLATVELSGETFGFEQLVASSPHGVRVLPGRVVSTDSRFGIGDRRYTEKLTARLSDDDVEWLVAAGPTLELRMEGKRIWIKVPSGGALVEAVRAYRDLYVAGAR